MKCNFCNSDMELKEKGELLIPIGNPRKIKVNADFLRCRGCGKELLHKEESVRVSKIVDEVNAKLDRGVDIESVEIKEGQIIL